MRRLAAAALVVAGLAVAGCGGGSSQPRAASGHTTVQAYDIYPPDTISVPSTDPHAPACRADAQALARLSARFVAHYGAASVYPADLSYVIMREELADFGARRCSPALLGDQLDRLLTASQRRVLLAHAPRVMAATLRRALSSVRS
jgi:hypothetical protein